MHVIHADPLGEPFGEHLEGELLVRGATERLPALVGDDHQGVLAAAVVAALLFQQLRDGGVDELVLDQPVEDFCDGKPVFGDLRLYGGHAKWLSLRHYACRYSHPTMTECLNPARAPSPRT